MNLLRWRGMWAVILGGLGLAMPAVAQVVDKLPPPPAAAADAPDEPVKTPSLLPAPDATPLVPVVPGASSLVDNSHEEGEGEAKSGLWILDGEYLLMAARQPNQQYAVIGTGPVLGPVGSIKAVDDSGYHSGFRLGSSFRFPGEDVEVAFRYTFFHAADNSGAGAPANGVLFATETHPGLVVQVQSADARSAINMNVFDLELGQRFDISHSLAGRVFAGPCFANIDQKFDVTYAGGDANRDDVRRRLFFNGGGVRAGGEVQLKFWEHYGTYFRGSGSMMAGRFRGKYSETANDLAVVDVTEKFNRVVPNLEMGLGLQYQNGGWRFSVGYEFITYFGMIDNVDFVDDANPAKVGRKTGNLSLDGIVFRSEYAF